MCRENPEPGAVGLNRVGGLDVCDPCFLGLAPHRARDRGWNISIDQWERTDQEGNVVAYITRAHLTLGKGIGVHFKSWRKTLLRKLLQMFKPSVSVGDSLFDHHVYTRSKNPGLTRRILGDEGVQSIIMDMLGEGSWIEFEATTLTTYSVRNEYVSEAKFTSEMCVLACHLERLALPS